MKPVKGLKSSSRKKTETAIAATKSEPIVTAAKAQPVINTQKNGHTGSASGNAGSSNKTITIEAKIDVGFGNSLYLRGEGKGLSWNQGVPLKNVDGSTWQWTGETGDQLKFKLLLNDTIWSKGEDVVAAPGQKVQISPAF